MSMFTGVESILKGLLFCLSISSLGTDLVVKYPKANLTKQEGEALTLNCTITYNQIRCGNFNAYWCKFNNLTSCIALTNSKRYLIQLSEIDNKNPDTRSRLITMSIKRLTLGDNGTYQCNAECGSNGLSARGNYMKISVIKADPERKDMKTNGISRIEATAMAPRFLILFVSTALYLC